jgi:tRNA-2-methylthio-N6-dimethylallyladenosine synthase
MPDICIASDFIVGFPTETDEDFAQTIEMVKHCRFKNSFIFKYSPRPGTTAIDRYPDDVPEDVKRKRNNDLLAIQGQISAANNRETVGKTVEVMVEGESKLVSKRDSYPSAPGVIELRWQSKTQRPGYFSDREPAHQTTTQLIGRTRGDQVVAFQGEPSLKGQILDVQIIDARNLTLFARRAQATVPA